MRLAYTSPDDNGNIEARDDFGKLVANLYSCADGAWQVRLDGAAVPIRGGEVTTHKTLAAAKRRVSLAFHT